MRVAVLVCGVAALSLAQAQTQIVSAGYDLPTIPSFTPGQVITLFVSGLNVPDAFAPGTPLPTTLSGVTVKVSSTIPNYPDQLPIFWRAFIWLRCGRHWSLARVPFNRRDG